MSWSLYGAYLVFVTLIVIAPGPDTLVVLKNSLTGGRPAGVLACVGITTGCVLQGTAAALGVGALIVRSQPVFDAVRVAGVIYLCWLGIQALRSARKGGMSGPLGGFGAQERAHQGAPAAGKLRAAQVFRAWRQGFLSNITNPKVLALFLSVLPQFLGRGHGSTADALLLAYTVPFLGTVWLLCVIAVVHRARTWIQQRRVRRAMDAVTGTALIGFGIALAAEAQ